MALNVWTQPSGYSIGTFEEQVALDAVSLPVNTGIPSFNNIVFTVISGALPNGVFLDGHILTGAPYVIDSVLNYTFCIRAQLSPTEIADRTYSMSINGVDAPAFITPEGLIAAGSHNQFYVLDGSYVNYQIEAIDLNANPGEVLTFSLETSDDILPPGLTLSSSGVINGFIEPTLTSLNRDDSYTFTVVITDGTNFSSRNFTIFVVDPDQFRADSLTFDGLAGMFTADSTFITNPVWLTPTDLGLYRANNYVTIPVGLYDNRNTTFRIETTNAEIYAVSVQLDPGSTDYTYVISNLAGLNTLTVTNVSAVPTVGTYFTFANFISSASNKIYRITHVVELHNGLYQLTLNANLELTLDNGVAFYMGTLSELPNGLLFDTATSELYGLIPYQPAITRRYTFTITASRSEYGSTEVITASRTFTMSVLGDITSQIIWNTDPALGTLHANYISTLSVSASSNVVDTIMNYEVTGGALPPGLSLSTDGELIGMVNQYFVPELNILGLITFDAFTEKLDGETLINTPKSAQAVSPTTFDNGTTTFDRDYNFTIQASDQYGYSAALRDFALSIDTPNNMEYSDITIRPFLAPIQRSAWRSFITNTTIFPPSSIYRPSDTNFGVQSSLSLIVFAGLETQTAAEYVGRMSVGFKKKRLHFNSFQKSLAIDPNTGDSVYEVIYALMYDPLEQLPRTVNGYNISSIAAWRDRLLNGETDIVDDNLANERNYLPLWMRTIQPGTKEQLGYTLAIPLCYCKVGMADDILLNIKYSNFDFKIIDYTVDRFTLKTVTGDKYLAFNNDRTTV